MSLRQQARIPIRVSPEGLACAQKAINGLSFVRNTRLHTFTSEELQNSKKTTKDVIDFNRLDIDAILKGAYNKAVLRHFSLSFESCKNNANKLVLNYSDYWVVEKDLHSKAQQIGDVISKECNQFFPKMSLVDADSKTLKNICSIE